MGKIFIGENDKKKIINDYSSNHKIEKVYIIGEDLDIGFDEKECIKFSDTIM